MGSLMALFSLEAGEGLCVVATSCEVGVVWRSSVDLLEEECRPEEKVGREGLEGLILCATSASSPALFCRSQT